MTPALPESQGRAPLGGTIRGAVAPCHSRERTVTQNQRRWFYIAVPVLLFWIVASIDKLGVSVIVTNSGFLKEMGLAGNTFAIGMLGTAFSITYGCCAIIWGFIVDRIGPKLSGIIGALIWSFTALLGGIANSFVMILISRLLLGIGEGSIYPVSHKFIGNWFDRANRARAQSVWVLGGPLGPVVGLPAIIFVMTLWGWRGGFYLLAALSFFIVVPALLFVTRDAPAAGSELALAQTVARTEEAQRSESTGWPSKFGNLIGGLRFWTLVVVATMNGFGFAGLSFWLPSYLRNQRHFPVAEMAGWVSASWLLAVLAVVITGWAIDRTQRPGIIGGCVFTSGAIAMAIAAFTGSPTLAAAMLAYGLATINSGSTLCQAMMLQAAGPQFAGRGAGIMMGFSNLIGGFSPVIIGAVVAMSGGSFIAGVMFLVACLLVGAAGYVLAGVLSSEFHRHDSDQPRAAAVPTGL